MSIDATEAKSILISVLNWNPADETIKCVQSLLKLDDPIDYTVNILVIDNGSENADWEILSRHSKWDLERNVPDLFHLARKALWFNHVKHL